MNKYELCKSCVHMEDCVYRLGRDQVFQCEEFEGERPKARKPEEMRRAAS